MAVHAVVAGVDFSTGEPLPKWGVARVEHRAIGLEPRQHVGIRLEAIGKLVEGELLEDSGVAHVRLRFELLGRLVELLFLPMHGDLCFADLRELLLCNCLRHLIGLLADTQAPSPYAYRAARPEFQNARSAIK